MISLQKRLLGRLRVAMTSSWLIMGLVLFFSVRYALMGRFDAELKAMASEVRFFLPEQRHVQLPEPPAHWLERFRAEGGLYYEVWDEMRPLHEPLPEENSLLPPPFPLVSNEPRFSNFQHEGRAARAIALRFSILPQLAADHNFEDQQSYTLHVVAARSRASLDQQIRTVAAMLIVVGLLIVPLSLLIARASVRKAMGPLRSFAEQMSALGMDSLSRRLCPDDVPEELRPVSERLNHLLDRLEAGIARERRLNADLAHELRTPAAELRTMAEVALAWPDKINSEHYQHVLDAAKQMQAIINGLLVLARCENGSDVPNLEEVDVAGIIDRHLRRQDTLIREKRLRLRMDATPSLHVQSNSELLQIILCNLIDNAVEYSPEDTECSLRSVRQGRGFSFSITNQVEHPFSDDEMADLFERFKRGRGRQSNAVHAGLGLPLALAAAHSLGMELTGRYDQATCAITLSLAPRETHSL